MYLCMLGMTARRQEISQMLTCKKREKARVEIRIKVQPGSNETILT